MEDPTLFSDVANYAQKLGFTNLTNTQPQGAKTTTKTAGFDDSDFRPEVANKKLVASNSVNKKQKSKNQNKQTKEDKQPGKKKHHQKDVDDNQKGKQSKKSKFSKKGDQQKQLQKQDWRSKLKQLKEKEDASNQIDNDYQQNEIQGQKVKPKTLLNRDEPQSWYVASQQLELPEQGEQLEKYQQKQNGNQVAKIDEEALQKLLEMGKQLQLQENAAFQVNMRRKNQKDMKWLQQVKVGGTTTDRIAACTLLIQESVIANIDSMDVLLQSVEKRKGGRTVVAQAMDALAELFMINLLPPDRKLKFLSQQTAINEIMFLTKDNKNLPGAKEAKKKLLYWYIEESIKRKYHAFVSSLDSASLDNLEFLREKALSCVTKLLSARPEQEGRLLSIIVNKLGDKNYKIASKACYLMTNLLLEHPAMKTVVVREVERYLFRPGLATKAQYYAVIFLNKTLLSEKQSDRELAEKLVDLYFMLFRLILSGKMGHAQQLQKENESKKDEKGKNKNSDKPRKKNKQKKKQKQQQQQQTPKAEEMDARMLSAIITGVRRAFPFVLAEKAEDLVQRHADQLYRLVHVAPFTVGVQALMLLFQLMTSKTSVNDRFYRAVYSSLLQPSFLSFSMSKPTMFLSMVFKAMKQDVNQARIAAFVKRLLQVSMIAPAHFACGVLLIISEVLKKHPGLFPAIMQPEDNDAEEMFEDLPAEDEKNGQEADDEPDNRGNASKKVKKGDENDMENEEEKEDELDIKLEIGDNSNKVSQRGIQFEPQDVEETEQGGKLNGLQSLQQYDMNKRDPQHCGAQTACWWELCTLGAHSHPTVSAWARTLLSGSQIEYEGDPLQDFTLPSFLDKFSLKKPKVLRKQPHSREHLSLRQQPLVQPHLDEAAAFALMEAGAAGPEDVLFGRYYEHRRNNPYTQAKLKKKQKKDRRDDEDESDQELDLLEEEEERAMAMEDDEQDLSDDLREDFDEEDDDSLVGGEDDDVGGVDKFDDFDEDDEEVDSDGDDDAEFEQFDLNDLAKEEDVSDDDINVFDIPSPGASEEGEKMEQTKSSKKRKRKDGVGSVKVSKKSKAKKDVFAPAEEFEELLSGYQAK